MDMDHAGVQSGSDLRSRWSADSSDDILDPGVIQTVYNWIRTHLGIAAMTSKFRNAVEYLWLVGLYLDRSVFY